MKLSEYIKHLQKILDDRGDLPCAYSEDDEGNSFHLIVFKPSCAMAIIDGNNVEIVDMEEAGDQPFTEVCLVN